MRLANIDNGLFERLGRYEAALWRQTVQTLFCPPSRPAPINGRCPLAGINRRRPLVLKRKKPGRSVRCCAPKRSRHYRLGAMALEKSRRRPDPPERRNISVDCCNPISPYSDFPDAGVLADHPGLSAVPGYCYHSRRFRESSASAGNGLAFAARTLDGPAVPAYVQLLTWFIREKWVVETSNSTTKQKGRTSMPCKLRSVLCAALFASVPAAQAADAPPEIKLGTLYASSGRYASISMPVHYGLKLWVEQKNAEGGVYVKSFDKKIPLKLVAYDDQSSTATAAACTLIADDYNRQDSKRL